MYVFVSHSQVDAEKSRELSTCLTKHEVPHFLDENNVEWGSQISQGVRSALEQTSHFVILVSPAAVESGWVNYELGIAEGLSIGKPGKIRILPWLVYPVQQLPSFLADRKYKSNLDEVIAELCAYAQPFRSSKPTSRFPSGYGYEHRGFSAQALRLIGAADEAFPQDRVKVAVSNQEYLLPDDFLRTKSEVISKLEAAAEARKAPFFNGPHTRLLDYSIHGINEDTEQKLLTLHLAPIGWHDYSVAHWHTEKMPPDQLRKYIDLDDIARTGRIVGSQLHNILDTATTLVTADGYLLFCKRGSRVSVQEGLFTSSVAENIHQEKDQSLSKEANQKLPAPFRTVLRGIDEEISPEVAHAFQEQGSPLYCLGLSFDLIAYHPDILFFAVLPLTWDEVLKAFHERVGQDFFEGKLRAVPLEDENSELADVLSLENWTGGGKASVIRALEFLDTLALHGKQSISEVLTNLLATETK